MNIFNYLKNNAYPGRGILVGRYDDKPVIAYFIMGRSENSRNRIFVKKDDILFTKAFDESRLSDPSLIIYNAIRDYKGNTIVTNGDQTDTIYDHLKNGQSFMDALNTREYEPDKPNYTPRISAMVNIDGSYMMSILKRKEDDCQRLYYSYEGKNGEGHFISTYDHDGDPLPPFSHEPLEADIDLPFEEFAWKLWDCLNEENRVSLYVRFGDKEKIFNRNGEQL
ncbi:MAG: IMP cyclohydrolase [Erysipelotrichaceae bacterium]|nr:IMP cyclohydrolase [Erysipelotrichaceae bacterium]